MKLALVTGARGFVGRHLAASLRLRDYKVCGLGHGAWPESDRAQWGVDHWINGDITKSNLDIVRATVGEPAAVFHLAGGSSVGLSLQTPAEDFQRSVVATAELLEWARLSAPMARLVLASSAAVYGAGYVKPIKETDRLSPYSPYGVHKRLAEELFESYAKSYGLHVTVVRLFSVYGEELRKQLLWDACAQLARSSSVLSLGGSGEEMRDWLHVADAASFLGMAAEKAGPACAVFNGGTGQAVSVREVAETLCGAWGEGSRLSFSGARRPGDPQYLVADTTRAQANGFRPRVDWRAGIAQYVEWFRASDLKART